MPSISCPNLGDTHRIDQTGGNNSVAAGGTLANFVGVQNEKSRSVSPATESFEVFEGRVEAFFGHNLMVGSPGANARQIIGDLIDGAWCVPDLRLPSDLSTCPTASPGLYRLTVALWTTSAITGHVVHTLVETLEFFGSVGSGLVCSCPGSGSGSGSMPGIEEAKSTSVALSTAPLVWGLIVSGFQAAQSILNGPWNLNLRDSLGGYCVWDNDGDGERIPYVQLSCESPLASTWKLTIRLGNDQVFEYVRPANEWNTLSTNVVYRSTEGKMNSVASQITVFPG